MTNVRRYESEKRAEAYRGNGTMLRFSSSFSKIYEAFTSVQEVSQRNYDGTKSDELFILTKCGCTREDPPRGTKTTSCFHTQKWSRAQPFAQCLGARRVPCVGQGSSRNGLAGQGPALDICAEETAAFQCNVVQRQCNIECNTGRNVVNSHEIAHLSCSDSHFHKRGRRFLVL